MIKNTRFLEPEEVLAENVLRDYERQIAFSFPATYRQFLLKHNGAPMQPETGNPEDFSLKYHIESFEDEAYSPDVKFFLSLSSDPESYDMKQVNAAMKDWGIPNSLHTFAVTAGNLKFFLCLSEKHRNTVMLGGQRYVEKYNNDEPITEEDFIVIAPSFEHFLNHLTWKKLDD